MRLAPLFPLFSLLILPALAQEQQFADLGDLKLVSGEVIRECRIGYRTFGKLNGSKSNAVLFPTWATGTTEQLAGNFGPGKLVDTTKYYVVAVDALANGVSSSPSNSRLQPRMKFPKITIRDMVESQHRFLTEVLHISHLKAVMGISMGGMQTFQWMVAYPGFMDRAIPIVGTPQQTAYDLVNWQAQIDAIMNDQGWHGGDYTTNPAQAADMEFGALLLTSPEQFNRATTRKQALDRLAAARTATGVVDANNKIRQAQAMIAIDVAEQTAAVKAKVLVIVATRDHVVTPGPAQEFAQRIGAQVVKLEGDCGHQAPGCEESTVKAAVARFLAE